MSLHADLQTVLVDHGPLDELHDLTLPSDRERDVVDVAFVPLSGIGAQRSLGSRPSARTTGVEHDGGVLWWHTGIRFDVRDVTEECRLLNPPAETVSEVANGIRDVLAQITGDDAVSYQPDGILRIDIGTPHFSHRDRRGRNVLMLRGEAWHRS